MVDSKDEVPVFRTFEIRLPMRIRTSAKKKQPLNLNVYRNLHFRSLSSQKNKFYEIAKKLLRGIPPLGVVTLHYSVCPKTKRRLDIMNVGSIVDKYFSDSLTAMGIIEDDDYTKIPQVTFAFGGLADEEHILVTITEIEPREEAMPMRVLLDQPDIQAALTTYVSSLNIPNATGVKLELVDGEIIAEVMFGLAENPPTEIPVDETEKPKRRRGAGGRPPGSKNKPKDPKPEETADVDAPVQDGAADSGAGDTSGSEGEAPEVTSEAETPKPKGTAKGNLFGDKDDPSSEGNTPTVAPDTAPEPTEPPVKRGSIFDA